MQFVHRGPHDTARFLAADCEALVLASFACPTCLERPDAVSLGDDDDGARAACACWPCDRRWEVALDPSQALRLALAPPEELRASAG